MDGEKRYPFSPHVLKRGRDRARKYEGCRGGMILMKSTLAARSKTAKWPLLCRPPSASTSARPHKSTPLFPGFFCSPLAACNPASSGIARGTFNLSPSFLTLPLQWQWPPPLCPAVFHLTPSQFNLSAPKKEGNGRTRTAAAA